jgi:hypothetical protein
MEGVRMERGARKIRERLRRRLPHAIKTPAASTIHAVLEPADAKAIYRL